MRALLIAIAVVLLSAATTAIAMPCIVSQPNENADYYIVELDGQFYRVDAVENRFKADVDCLSRGWHDIGISAVNEFGSSAPVYFLLYKEKVKGKFYYTIYPEEGYEQQFSENLFIIIGKNKPIRWEPKIIKRRPHKKGHRR